jgi:ferredoxin
MSNQMNIPEGDSGMKEIPQGPNSKAKLKFYDCKGSGECIKACPEKAISEGPQRMPAAVCISEGRYAMLPGKAVIDEDKCTGCGDCVPVCPNHAIEMVTIEA